MNYDDLITIVGTAFSGLYWLGNEIHRYHLYYIVHDHDLLYLLTQEMDDIIQDLEYNQEHKTADKLEKIVSPLWNYEDEIKEVMDKHRKILIKVVQDLKDLVKVYGIK